MTGSFIGSVSWVVGFEEHLELNAVGVLECQDRTVFTLGDWRVGDAELFEPSKPVVQIGTGRARQTRSNWLVTGAAAAVNVALNLALIPSYGRMGAAVATVVACTLLFVGMAWRAQRVFPVSYQWRRVATLAVAAVGLTVLGKAFDAPLAVALVLTAAFPLVLLVLGFYLPAERRRLRRLLPILGR